MLLEVKTSEQARLLQLDGYARQGREAVVAQTFESAREVLDRDNVEVTKLVIQRNNSDEEANLIDWYLTNGIIGKKTATTVVHNTRASNDTWLNIKGRRGNTVSIKEDKITAKVRYRDVINKEFDTDPSQDNFEEQREYVLDELDSTIGEYEQKLANLREKRDELQSLTYEEFVEENR